MYAIKLIATVLFALFLVPSAISVGSRGGGSRTHRRLIKFTVNAASTGETDTGIDLPANCAVDPDSIFVHVRTAEVTGATKTIDIGLLSSESGGDADGFVDGLSVASTGIKKPGVAVTAGGTETYVSSNTLGVLLSTFLAGANVAGDVGTFEQKAHHSDAVTAKSISVSFANAMTELVADIYIEIILLES